MGATELVRRVGRVLQQMRRLSHGMAGRTKATLGAVDRLHNGLVSGWFACGVCGEAAAASPVLLLDGKPARVTARLIQRDDVPRGTGFIFRFAPVAKQVSTVRVICAGHPESTLERSVGSAAWQERNIAEIQSCVWPEVMGWWVNLEGQALIPQLVVESVGEFPVMPNRALGEWVNFLGVEGLGGFSLNLGRLLGFAPPDGTRVSLRSGNDVVARAVVAGSPLDEGATPCWVGGYRRALDNHLIGQFGRHFGRGMWLADGNSWRDSYAALGFGVAADAQDQWARYLTSQGTPVDRIVETLEERARDSLGVATISSLPAGGGLSSGRSWESLINLAEVGDGTSRSGISDRTQLKVVVAGLTSHKSGLGENARRSIHALTYSGVHACQAPFFPAVGGWNRELGLIENRVHDLSDHIVLLHSPMDMVVPTLCAQPALLTSRKLIGFYMWETEAIPAPLVRSLHVVDEVWTATKFVAEAFRRVTSTPVRVVGHAVSIDAADELDRASLGVAETDFVVHFAFDANSTVARKNPGAAIRAFQRAFAADSRAKFVLKVRNWAQAESLAYAGDPSACDLLDLIANEPRLRLVTGEQSHSYALGLIAMADCFISLHRSEGFGYGIAEAMSLEVPVVATAYSGSLDLTTPDSSWLIPWQPVDVLPGEYFFWDEGMFWADADVDAAADALQAVRAGGVNVESRVRAAKERVEREASLSRLSKNYLAALIET